MSKSIALQVLPGVVLASTSRYRRELLSRLNIPFEVASPEVDETALPGEPPPLTAERLALAKARAVGVRFPHCLVIGSDQVAYEGESAYGKPGDRDGAIAQLRRLSGRSIVFQTAVCVLNVDRGTFRQAAVPTIVQFRTLSDAEIERYVDADRPFDCAGAARSESLGIALLESMRGDDPTALIGLPLIALSRMLREEGLTIP